MPGTGQRPMVIGHKGASVEAPENTLASFARALELGAPGLECDIRATADGVPVIIHDATVDRTTDGAGEVASLSLAQIRTLDASLGRKAFRGERIPTLDELLALVSGRALLALEFKTLDAVAPSIATLKRHDAARWCTAWSFSAEILAALRRLVPDLSRSQNIGRIDGWQEALDRAHDLGCIGVSLAFKLADAGKVADSRARGLRFYTWTANDPPEWDYLIALGVDGIVTDDPGGLLRRLGA